MAKKDFLFELGCEEIPARVLEPITQAIARGFTEEFKLADLTHDEPKLFSTPRRIAVLFPKLSAKQAPRTIERQGPGAAAAFDKDGTPTLACMGFARSCGVTADELEVRDTPKGKRVFCKVEQPGQETLNLLPEISNHVMNKLPLSKPMRWSNHRFGFIRPVHWLLMLFGGDTVNTQLFNLKASNVTYGHRFHAPQAIIINNPSNYSGLLAERAHVIPDFNTRKAMIRKQVKAAAGNGNTAIIDEKLLDEVTGLVEWPVALRGEFKREFLNVPREVLITSMKTHQKCFPVESSDGKLLNYFIVVSNIESKDPATVIKGNERVIHARLSDAEFFYNNDLKHSLESRLPKLTHVVFQKQLGTIADKAQRVSLLAHHIAKLIDANTEVAERAGMLCKSDLVSEMVLEFTSLQGTMGYYYALNDKESKECADAIKQHYMPKFSGDALPDTNTNCAVALADRLDTLVGILGVNLIPTGDKDPYALRRASLGILRTLIEKNLKLNLTDLLKQAKQHYAIELPNKEVVAQAFAFLMDRLKYWYQDQGVSIEVFESVYARNPESPLDFHQRVQAVQQFQTLPEADSLAAANKRVSNILKKTEFDATATCDEKLLELDEEKALFKELAGKTEALEKLYQNADYNQALSELASLKTPVDAFFDKVMVMVDDKKLRDNRLALLASLRKLFTRVADISLLSL